ncbi:hypothetical protein HY637_05900 [Candidatus Woesearchaeota archaeon]|nr:hypothetical protein [Candidatus Woesearchaeota archaeon]
MNSTYRHIKFEQRIEQQRDGNTKKVRALMSPLEEICESLSGCRLYTSIPESTKEPGYHFSVFDIPIIDANNQYLVGATWVRNEVSIIEGVRLTLLTFLEEHANQKLIDRLKELYGEDNMRSHTGTVQVRE